MELAVAGENTIEVVVVFDKYFVLPPVHISTEELSKLSVLLLCFFLHLSI